jgi:hypothetical protein
MIALSDDEGESWHMRRQPLNARIEYKNGAPILISGWQPWPDVSVETSLVPPAEESPNWHIRVHRVKTGRALRTAEGAFAIHGCKSSNGRELGPLTVDGDEGIQSGPSSALVVSSAGAVSILDLKGGRKREGVIVKADPNSNVVDSRTVIPSLLCSLEGGSSCVFVTAVFAVPSSLQDWRKSWRGGWEERRFLLPTWLLEEVEQVHDET